MPLQLPFTPEYCELETKGRLLIVRLNRPKAMNSQPPAMHVEMSCVWDAYEADPDLWVAIITGNGKAFSAGFDLKAASGMAPEEDVDASRYFKHVKPSKSGFCGLTERKGCVKPIIAAVNGIAHGGGFETALACDVIVASQEHADFALPEVKVGLFAAAGGVVRLPRIIGYHNAMAMILTGRRVKADEALKLGIVQQVVPHAELMGAAEALANKILEGNPDAVGASIAMAKASWREMQSAHTDEISLIRAQNDFAAVRRQEASENKMIGPMAFSMKQKPEWKPPKPLSEFQSKL